MRARVGVGVGVWCLRWCWIVVSFPAIEICDMQVGVGFSGEVGAG